MTNPSRYDREEVRTKEDNERLRAEIDRLRERLDKTLGDLDKSRKEMALVETTRTKFGFEEKEKLAEMERYKEELQRTLNK